MIKSFSLIDMTTKERMVEAVGTAGVMIPIRLGYEPFGKEDMDFLTAKKPPYIFMAIINQGGNIKVVLGDARRHQELRQAIIKDIGMVDSYEYGQVVLKDGLLRRITLHHTDSTDISDIEAEEKLLSIVGVFSQELLGSEGVIFTYNATAGDAWEYRPKSGEIIKRPFTSF